MTMTSAKVKMSDSFATFPTKTCQGPRPWVVLLVSASRCGFTSVGTKRGHIKVVVTVIVDVALVTFSDILSFRKIFIYTSIRNAKVDIILRLRSQLSCH